MAINYDKLMKLEFPEVEQSYSLKDTMLYGLGVGLGMDPLDEAQLRFVYEKDLRALPTMAGGTGAVTCASPKRDSPKDRSRRWGQPTRRVPPRRGLFERWGPLKRMAGSLGMPPERYIWKEPTWVLGRVTQSRRGSLPREFSLPLP